MLKGNVKRVDTMTTASVIFTRKVADEDDILDFSKIEAGKFEIENYPFKLSHILDRIANY